MTTQTAQISIIDLHRALETLWTDMGALARNPLVDQLELMVGRAEQDKHDVYKRASALIGAILTAAHQFKAAGNEEAFALLNRAYELESPRLITRPSYATHQELAEKAGMTVVEYEQELQTILVDLRSFL